MRVHHLHLHRKTSFQFHYNGLFFILWAFYCGTQEEKGDKFCPSCGKPVEPGQTQPSQHATASVTKLLQKLNKKVALIVAATVVLMHGSQLYQET
jgi:predicted nucleic acid-binding Zn ribbon protein